MSEAIGACWICRRGLRAFVVDGVTHVECTPCRDEIEALKAAVERIRPPARPGRRAGGARRRASLERAARVVAAVRADPARNIEALAAAEAITSARVYQILAAAGIRRRPRG